MDMIIHLKKYVSGIIGIHGLIHLFFNIGLCQSGNGFKSIWNLQIEVNGTYMI